jgi:hypothetical protein
MHIFLYYIINAQNRKNRSLQDINKTSGDIWIKILLNGWLLPKEDRYNKELMQLFGDLDLLSFVIRSLLNWICHVNWMDGKRKVSQVFNNNPQGSRLRVRLKNRWWNSVQTDISKWKITIWKERSKTELTGRILTRGRSAFECNAV